MYCFVILLLFNEMQMSVRRFSAIPHLRANLGHSRTAQPNCSGNVFVEKRNQYHLCCFGILHGTVCHICPLGGHLRNNSGVIIQ